MPIALVNAFTSLTLRAWSESRLVLQLPPAASAAACTDRLTPFFQDMSIAPPAAQHVLGVGCFTAGTAGLASKSIGPPPPVLTSTEPDGRDTLTVPDSLAEARSIAFFTAGVALGAGLPEAPLPVPLAIAFSVNARPCSGVISLSSTALLIRSRLRSISRLAYRCCARFPAWLPKNCAVSSALLNAAAAAC